MTSRTAEAGAAPELVYLQDSPSLAQVADAVALLAEHALVVTRTLGPTDAGRVAAVVIGLGGFTRVDAARFPKLRTVAKFGAGSDGIDVDGLWSDRQVAVSCTAGGGTRDVAEFALALIVLALRGAARDIRHLGGDPTIWRDIPRGISLGDAMTGIVGSGQIGTETGRLLAPLAKRVMFWNRAGRAVTLPGADPARVTTVSDLAILAESADVVSTHVALAPQTTGLIGAAFFDRVRAAGRQVALVNTARGEVVDETALLAALEDGTVRAACIDVWSAEGAKDNAAVRALRRHPSVLPTSHIGAFTHGVQQRYAMICARNIIAAIAGDADALAPFLVRPVRLRDVRRRRDRG